MLSILGYLRPNADAGLFRCSFATASDGYDDQLSPAERDAAILKGDLLPDPLHEHVEPKELPRFADLLLPPYL